MNEQLSNVELVRDLPDGEGPHEGGESAVQAKISTCTNVSIRIHIKIYEYNCPVVRF